MPGIETALTFDLGTDLQYVFTVYTSSAKTTVRQVTVFSLSFMLKRALSDADALALLTKVTPTDVAIAGTFNSDPLVNTEKVTVTFADTDFSVDQKALTGFWELKRTGAGVEGRLAFGEMELVRTVHRA